MHPVFENRKSTSIRLRFIVGLFAVALVGGVLSACGSGSQDGRQKVTFVLDFNVLGRHALFFTALKKGYYADEGLDVEFQKSSGSADTIKTLSAGRAKLGYADAATLAVVKGQQAAPVKLTAVVYQNAPYGIYALAKSGIKEPKDLQGKTMADGAGSSVTAMFSAYAQLAGIDPKTVKHTVADPSTLVSLLASGRVDAIGQNVMGAALIRKSVEGKEVTELKYSDAGLKVYSNGILATDSVLKNDPELVRKFVRATIKGMKYAFANPEEAGKIFHGYHPEIDADIATAETKVVAGLAQTPDTDTNGLGHIDPALLKSTISVVEKSFDMKEEVTVDSMYEAGFVTK